MKQQWCNNLIPWIKSRVTEMLRLHDVQLNIVYFLVYPPSKTRINRTSIEPEMCITLTYTRESVIFKTPKQLPLCERIGKGKREGKGWRHWRSMDLRISKPICPSTAYHHYETHTRACSLGNRWVCGGTQWFFSYTQCVFCSSSWRRIIWMTQKSWLRHVAAGMDRHRHTVHSTQRSYF